MYRAEDSLNQEPPPREELAAPEVCEAGLRGPEPSPWAQPPGWLISSQGISSSRERRPAPGGPCHPPFGRRAKRRRRLKDGAGNRGAGRGPSQKQKRGDVPSEPPCSAGPRARSARPQAGASAPRGAGAASPASAALSLRSSASHLFPTPSPAPESKPAPAELQVRDLLTCDRHCHVVAQT